MSPVRLRFLSAFAAAAVGVGASARAAFVIQLAQAGTNVVATGSGTLNLAALTSLGTTTDPGFVDPSIGFVGVGPPVVSSTSFYSLLTGPITFGTGGNANPTSGTGPEVIIAGQYEEVGVPAGYTSGAALSDSATFAGTFASLGITPGTYTWNWGTGATADSLTVTTTTVPEPALLAVACVPPVLISRRWRRRRQRQRPAPRTAGW